ncbi:MAG: hypothetical protein AAFN43_07550 [Pseudomonadota bacterium]
MAVTGEPQSDTAGNFALLEVANGRAFDVSFSANLECRLEALVSRTEMSPLAGALGRLLVVYGKLAHADELTDFYQNETIKSDCRRDLKLILDRAKDRNALFSILPARAVAFIIGLDKQLKQ